MTKYKCFNKFFGQIKKLNDLKKRVSEGLLQFKIDYNLENLIIDLKTREDAKT